MSTTEEMIEKMYASQLKSQKEQLDTDYMQAVLDLDAQQRKNQQATDANLNRTAVEAQKAAVNNAELHNAYGLSSGTRAQARLAQENQLQADMTALRAAQQNADADVERQRSLLAQAYSSEIRKAQAENDLALAEALYAGAKEEEEKLLAKQEAAGKLMADVAKDYSLLGKLYGLSEKEVAALAGAASKSDNTEVEEEGSTADNIQSGTPSSDLPLWKELLSMLAGNNDTTTQGTTPPSASQPTTPEEYADLPIDEASVLALGFGPISAERVEELLAAGIIEEYVEDGYIKYRRKKTAGNAWNPWWK